MTINIPALLFAFFLGLFLGLFFFTGLWLTVRRLPESRHPALLSVASFLGRAGLLLLGFWAIGDGDIQRWLAALVGFVTVRVFFGRGISRGRFGSAREGFHGSHSD